MADTITVTVNNESIIFEPESTLLALLSQQKLSSTFAIAVNDTFIAKHTYDSTIIKDGDRIDIITPMQGG